GPVRTAPCNAACRLRERGDRSPLLDADAGGGAGGPRDAAADRRADGELQARLRPDQFRRIAAAPGASAAVPACGALGIASGREQSAARDQMRPRARRLAFAE